MRRVTIVGAALMTLAFATTATAAKPAPVVRRSARVQYVQSFGPGYEAPHHAALAGIVFGGQAELRFASDRVLGVGNPDWASVQRVSGFARARIHPRIQLVGEVAYDKATDDLVVERALIVARVRATMDAQAGVLLVPLGHTNLEHDAPRSEFNDRSLVATEVVGVPNAQLGAGVRGR